MFLYTWCNGVYFKFNLIIKISSSIKIQLNFKHHGYMCIVFIFFNAYNIEFLNL